MCCRLLLLALLCLMGRIPAAAQTTTIPASDVNRMVYVSNAIYHTEADPTRGAEKVALAAYVAKAYSGNRNPNPSLVIRNLLTAQDRFDRLYRSVSDYENSRFRMDPLDIISNMLSILAALPGNSVAAELSGESVGFAMNAGFRLGGPTSWLDSSTTLGRSRAIGGFGTYRNQQLEAMFNAARAKPNAAYVVNAYFGSYFNANTNQATAEILANNPALRDSPNFAPIVAAIGADGSITILLSQARQIHRDFFDRMTAVSQSYMAAFRDGVIPLQTGTHTYAQFYQTPALMTSAQNAVAAARAINAPKMVAAEAATYATPFTIAPDPTYAKYQQDVAIMRASAAGAELAGQVAEAGSLSNLLSSGSKFLKASAAGLEFAAASMDAAAAFGEFGKSDEEVIMEGVGKLSAQLHDVQVQMNNRLNIMDARIIQLYDTMNQQFDNVVAVLQNVQTTLADIQDSVRLMQSSLLDIQSSIDRLTQNIYEFESQSVRNHLSNDLREIDTYARNGVPVSLERYITLYSRTLDYTLNAAFSAAEIGPALTNRAYTDLGVNAEFALSPNPEWNINYALEFARRRFGPSRTGSDLTNFQTVSNLGASNTTIANPRAWEMAVMGMMRLAAHAPQHFVATTVSDTSLSGTGFFGARLVGRAIQNMVANTTLNANGTKSPLFANLLAHQNLQATALKNALIALEGENGQSWSNVGDRQAIRNRILTQWTTSSPSVPKGVALQNAAKQLNGSRALLNTLVNFGLSRSLEGQEILSSLLYSPQRLPDDALVYALYDGWTTGNADNPRAAFEAAQTERANALSTLLSNTLDHIAAENAAGYRVGEPLSSIEVMLKRMDYFTLARVAGKITPSVTNTPTQGRFPAGLPITLTFQSTSGTFVVPIELDAQGNFVVFVPDDVYNLSIKAENSLRVTFPVNTVNANHLDIGTRTLKMGDIFPDNRIDARDLTLLRNAWESRLTERRWSLLADLNGNGSVNNDDLLILKANFGQIGNP